MHNQRKSLFLTFLVVMIVNLPQRAESHLIPKMAILQETFSVGNLHKTSFSAGKRCITKETNVLAPDKQAADIHILTHPLQFLIAFQK